ncbi:ATP-binding protein [bacterium D16-51]|nr:ATP-binding protein [bacterium D16-59]RKI58827.1 ATP-binding protein [bacterium D16-51]
MASELMKSEQKVLSESPEMAVENRLEIIDEYVRRKYLTRLSDMQIMPVGEITPLEEDIIDNIRLYRITELVYRKDESVMDKFTTVFNTLATYNASVFFLIDSDGRQAKHYLGVRNNEANESSKKRSTVTLGDTLKQTLIGHFPGVKIENEDRKKIAELSEKIIALNNVSSVSVVGSSRREKEQPQNEFAQGMEKLCLAMSGRPYTAIIIADNKNAWDIQQMRKQYQELYTALSSLQKVQISDSTSETESRSQSFAEMDGKQKAAMITNATVSIVGTAAGVALGAKFGSGTMAGTAAMLGGQIGGQAGGQISSFISSLAPTKQISKVATTGVTTTEENKAVTDMLVMLDEALKKMNEYDSYGLWNVAGYFLSDDMSASEIAASNYRSLMNGDNYGREVSAINSWRKNDLEVVGEYRDLTTYLSRFVHPLFNYGGNIMVSPATNISGKELGIHLGLPRSTVPGLSVIEHAEFGKEVNTYQLFEKETSNRPEDMMTLGRVFDMGLITDKIVELNNKSLNMHTFITGSTGSGKSNTVYQILTELRQDRIPFLVIEPAKGEYKDVFGHLPDVNVFSTNPCIAQLININPFMFPASIHVLEHIDGLVEIFSVCWPMYDAMPAFFKDALLKSYEVVGWDLGSSIFEGENIAYPDFEVLAEQLDKLITNSDYAAEIKSNYRGALLTRVKSLAVGLNKYIFTEEQTPYEKLFDENCILDISRVKSSETKALLMGLMVYILNEYRVDQKTGNNNGLRHVTVLEEAHNLLKNTSGGESELVGKSVEMITNSIAEIRTYGEGFIIVDQSPSSVDIAAIKNTNTKIVLRTPEANDREAVGRSMGLSTAQVNEIAKLPSGVAVVYQNNWISPVLTLVDKAKVREVTYRYENPIIIKTAREARTELLCMLLQPWISREQYRGKSLRNDLKALDIPKRVKDRISACIEQYLFFQGNMIWKTNEIGYLQKLVKALLAISDNEFENIVVSGNADELRNAIKQKTIGLSYQEIEEVCCVLTMEINKECE